MGDDKDLDTVTIGEVYVTTDPETILLSYCVHIFVPAVIVFLMKIFIAFPGKASRDRVALASHN